jgi:hypothetical protein
MVYQGIEPLKPRTLASTCVTNPENVIGVLVNEARTAREIISYLSAAIVVCLLQPRIWTREFETCLGKVVPLPPLLTDAGIAA